MQEIKEKSHITEEMWIALERDTISQPDYMQILEHTGDCTWCAERLADVLEQNGAICKPPSYLTEQILERTGQLDVQAAFTVKRTSKRLQLLLYSLKVSAAVVMSILILGITSNIEDMGFHQMGMQEQETQLENDSFTEEEEKETMLEMVNRAACGLTDRMNTFANQLLNGGK